MAKKTKVEEVSKVELLANCCIAIKENLNEMEVNMTKFITKENKAAGGRVRKNMQFIVKFCKEGRKLVSEIKETM